VSRPYPLSPPHEKDLAHQIARYEQDQSNECHSKRKPSLGKNLPEDEGPNRDICQID